MCIRRGVFARVSRWRGWQLHRSSLCAEHLGRELPYLCTKPAKRGHLLGKKYFWTSGSHLRVIPSFVRRRRAYLRNQTRWQRVVLGPQWVRTVLSTCRQLWPYGSWRTSYLWIATEWPRDMLGPELLWPKQCPLGDISGHQRWRKSYLWHS